MELEAVSKKQGGSSEGRSHFAVVAARVRQLQGEAPCLRYGRGPATECLLGLLDGVDGEGARHGIETNEGALDTLWLMLSAFLVLRDAVQHTAAASAAQLCRAVEEAGADMMRQLSAPYDWYVGNLVSRVQRTIRSEVHAAAGAGEVERADERAEMLNVWQRLPLEAGTAPDAHSQRGATASADHLETQVAVQEALTELEEELRSSRTRIAKQSIEFVHAEEVVLVHGHSLTVLHFLLRAAKTRRFQVIVAEAAPSCSGHAMVRALARENMDVTLIADASVFAIMSRVHKVVLEGDVILADGSAVGRTGALLMALAAQRHTVPVLLLTPWYQLSAVFPQDFPALHSLHSPATVLGYADTSAFRERVAVTDPLYDHLPADLVTLFVLDRGSYPGSFLYHLLRDLYGAAPGAPG
ncbi:hypothetical protein CDCA_CDCA02G0512 [Cyanidium caldarium]|uniref:Translation initiation factor eIF2B subunit beta n=1 Tax=Cyanidium caldarium TaxID=2771 RepID=A0AAV9IQH3_CYACA|nr:hypothetical protein CDCA_CDCA02G0512 [Cyanidium caldarium]